jgi:hypothetical protein
MNIIDILNQRALGSKSYSLSISSIFEEDFLISKETRDYDLNPASVLSTIAIDISHDW